MGCDGVCACASALMRHWRPMPRRAMHMQGFFLTRCAADRFLTQPMPLVPALTCLCHDSLHCAALKACEQYSCTAQVAPRRLKSQKPAWAPATCMPLQRPDTCAQQAFESSPTAGSQQETVAFLVLMGSPRSLAYSDTGWLDLAGIFHYATESVCCFNIIGHCGWTSQQAGIQKVACKGHVQRFATKWCRHGGVGGPLCALVNTWLARLLHACG